MLRSAASKNRIVNTGNLNLSDQKTSTLPRGTQTAAKNNNSANGPTNFAGAMVIGRSPVCIAKISKTPSQTRMEIARIILLTLGRCLRGSCVEPDPSLGG